jgi:hypothetical protein
MHPVELKVPVESPNFGAWVEFGHADEAGIRVRHRTVTIPPHKFVNASIFLMEIKFYAQESDFNQGKEIVRLVAITLQEEQRFGNNGFAGQNFRRRFFALFDRPRMRMIIADEQSDQRTCIYNPCCHRP